MLEHGGVHAVQPPAALARKCLDGQPLGPAVSSVSSAHVAGWLVGAGLCSFTTLTSPQINLTALKGTSVAGNECTSAAKQDASVANNGCTSAIKLTSPQINLRLPHAQGALCCPLNHSLNVKFQFTDDIAIAEAIAAVEKELQAEKKKSSNYQSVIVLLAFIIIGLISSQIIKSLL